MICANSVIDLSCYNTTLPQMLWLWIKYMLISATVLSKFSFKKPKYFFHVDFTHASFTKHFPKINT